MRCGARRRHIQVCWCVCVCVYVCMCVCIWVCVYVLRERTYTCIHKAGCTRNERSTNQEGSPGPKIWPFFKHITLQRSNLYGRFVTCRVGKISNGQIFDFGPLLISQERSTRTHPALLAHMHTADCKIIGTGPTVFNRFLYQFTARKSLRAFEKVSVNLQSPVHT